MAKIELYESYEHQTGAEAAIVKWGRDFYTAYQPASAANGCGGNWSSGGGFGNDPCAAVRGLTYGPDDAERNARMLLRDARAELADAGYSQIGTSYWTKVLKTLVNTWVM